MNLHRRSLLWGMAALAAPAPSFVMGQEQLLPLRTPGLDHLDVIVPDVEATTKFYMGLFKTELHAQEFQGGYRYFVLLNPLNEKREAGYIAVGDARGRGSYIGHFCTSVYDWRRDGEAIFKAMGERFGELGFGEFPGARGFGGIFADPDDIEIQFLPAPDTVVTAANPSQLVPWHQGLVTPHGMQSVLLRVSNLERAVVWYSVLYGDVAWTPDRSRAYFEFPASQTRLYLEQAQYEYGQKPEIALFGIKVDPFDRDEVAAGVAALGGKVLPVPGNDSLLRIEDPDGNIVQLHPVQRNG
jgi:catechol 2,3-dioxygenase-like lactoylglutathione lyase family enzyme